MPSRVLAVLPALLALSACGPRALQVAPSPLAPEAEAAEPPVDGEEEIGESFELSPAPAGHRGGVAGSVDYDLPVVGNEWVRMELEFLVHQRTDVVRRWMERARPYEPFVRGVLAEHGLPGDLIHLAMIESGFQPTVRSRAGAVGIWQFMPATARSVGLRVDSLVDERMDPVRSTRAAARHLGDLHRRFGGDWELAAAAYNAGAGRIGRGLERFGVRDFWELARIGDLAQETRHYVPRLYAMTIIGREPERFGYTVPAEPPRPFGFDSLRVELATPLALLASLGGVSAEELGTLNPHLIRRLAPRDYLVWVPEGAAGAMADALRGSEYRRRGGYALYTVRPGDSPAAIALAGGMTPEELRELNDAGVLDRMRAGTRVRVYADASRLLARRAAPAAASAARTHTVASGESLWVIARRYGVSVSALQRANGLAERAVLRPGQRLTIPRPT
jgi:membrane-bound lytic murein transglycosylase D